MAGAGDKHVFVSYVRQDADRVDALCEVLEASGIPYWRDRTSLAPGDAWKSKIRDAIRDGSLVFLACFSDASRGRDKSYMNEELTLAVEEFRKMPPGRTWIIPVRLDDGDVPPWDLGAGRTLDDINFVDLFGAKYAANAASLVTTIHRLLGDRHLDAASMRAAVEQVDHVDRTDMLRRLTKEMLVEPARRIELSELIEQEVRRVLRWLTDPNQVAGLLPGSNEDHIVEIVERSRKLWQLTEPFCASLQVAARWGTPVLLDPWVDGIQAFAAAAHRMDSGVTALLSQRYLPAVTTVAVAAVSCVAARNWENLRVLVVEPTVRDQHLEGNLSLVEVAGPYKIFDGDETTANVASRTARADADVAQIVTGIARGEIARRHSPAAEWLHDTIRPLFDEQLPDAERYDTVYDRAEVLLGSLAQDLANIRARPDFDGKRRPRAYWFGRATWRAERTRQDPAQDLVAEALSQAQAWPLLAAGLFGGDQERAEAALTTHAEQFAQMAHNRI